MCFFHVQYLTFCGYYWHLHGSVFRLKYKNRNPNRTDRSPFSNEEIEALWVQRNNLYVQIVLMLIYSGVRVSELLDLKRENVHIDEHYFNVVESKTENGIRIVPIADKTYSFFRKWHDDGCEYLLHTPEGAHFDYRNYYDSACHGTHRLLSQAARYSPHLHFHAY